MTFKEHHRFWMFFSGDEWALYAVGIKDKQTNLIWFSVQLRRKVKKLQCLNTFSLLPTSLSSSRTGVFIAKNDWHWWLVLVGILKKIICDISLLLLSCVNIQYEVGLYGEKAHAHTKGNIFYTFWWFKYNNYVVYSSMVTVIPYAKKYHYPNINWTKYKYK